VHPGRKRLYFTLMGVCLGLILLAWNVVRLFSTGLAIAMSVVAALIPPVAATLVNWPTMTGREPLAFEDEEDDES
jgi:uncharacterized oligopeptide transporter (OPT) family protein